MSGDSYTAGYYKDAHYDITELRRKLMYTISMLRRFPHSPKKKEWLDIVEELKTEIAERGER